MRLKYLEIQGFKSFPDKTRLEFGDGITAVVGPNGSGKSNIADAVRWVMGEQSTKTLRGKSMEDVIFGGTQQRKAIGFAFVQICIDNADRAIPAPDNSDEITISRKLYRSGESEYRIGGALVRLKDVHELLMDTGLGRDGYSIIGQGRIAEIVAAKSTHRREIFEEATGIAKYRYRKEESEKRLAQAEENLLRLRDILLELEGRVGPLKAQAEKARAFLSLSEEKKSLEISLWMLSLAKLREQLAAQEDKLLISRSDYEQAEQEAAAIEQRINDTYDRSQQLLIQVEQQRAEAKEFEDMLARGDSESAVLQNEIRHNLLAIERAREELANTNTGAAELAAKITEKQQALAESAQSIEWVDGRIAAAEERVTEQKQLAAKLDEELNGLMARRDSAAQSVADAKLEKAAGAGLIEDSLKRLESLGQSTGAHRAAAEELDRSAQECEQQVAEQEEKISALENGAKGYALKRGSRAAKLGQLDEKIAQLEKSAAQKRDRAKLLQDMEAHLEGFGGSVKYILAESKKRSIEGVHGAVSSIIDTDAAYAVAIETALGAAMQNIIVEDEDTAKRAIRMLQNANAGRATFLPLTSVKGSGGLNTRELAGQDGFVAVAAELCRADEKYKGIISQLLGRIAIVEDLNSGTRIARQNGYKFRIVTLDGQVINAGGSYTGGSTARSSGVLGRRHEIDKLLAEAGAFTSEAAGLAPQRKAAAEELASIDAYIKGAEAEQQTAREELVRLGFLRESLAKELEQARQNRLLAEREREQLAERLEQLRGSESSAEQLLAELAGTLDALSGQIEDVTERRKQLAVGIETASQALSEQRLARAEAQNAHNLISQEIAGMQEQAQDAGSREGRLKAEQRGYEAQNTELQAKILDLDEQKRELGARIEQLKQSTAALLERRTELESQTTGLRLQEKEISSRRESISRETVRLEEHKNTLQTGYDQIIAKLWDEYELTRSKAKELAQPLENIDKANRRLSELRGKIKALGSVNVEAIDEYAEVSGRYEFLSAQVADVEKSRQQLQKLIGDLAQEMRDIFLENFTKIAAHFSRIFVQLFGGGKAELTLTAADDVLESGVEIFVQPPGKIIKNLAALSGGEQAFVAIAIYFAFMKVRPAPFCIVDEIETALDDMNVVRFASYMRQMSGKTQFIAITHRRGTMEEADMLYGVTMQDVGVSKLLELNVHEVEAKLGIK